MIDVALKGYTCRYFVSAKARNIFHALPVCCANRSWREIFSTNTSSLLSVASAAPAKTSRRKCCGLKRQKNARFSSIFSVLPVQLVRFALLLWLRSVTRNLCTLTAEFWQFSRTGFFLQTVLQVASAGRKETIRENWRTVVNTATLEQSVPREKKNKKRQAIRRARSRAHATHQSSIIIPLIVINRTPGKTNPVLRGMTRPSHRPNHNGRGVECQR